MPPPEGKPDMWVVVNVVMGALAFGVCYLWCTAKLVLRSGLLEEYFGDRRRIESRAREGEGEAKKKL